MTRATSIERAVSDRTAWVELVEARAPQLSEFLLWAYAREDAGLSSSLRLENRGDLDRCRSVLPLFEEEWWGVVVYSCFDSVVGTTVAAGRFVRPIQPSVARVYLTQLEFPRGSVQHHRAQSTLKGAKKSLVSVCEKAEAIRDVLAALANSFDSRFEDLKSVDVSWWGRTTCFDTLLRSGGLAVTGQSYRPELAYLAGSTGPAAGFKYLWGEAVTRTNADSCEQLLRMWTGNWEQVAHAVRVPWVGRPYDSGDFENALCVFQETMGAAGRTLTNTC